MDDLKWFEPKTKVVKSDVSVKIGTTNLKTEQVYMTFRNGLYQMVTETGRIKVAVSGDRMYFGQSSSENTGYKLVKSNTKADNRYFCMNGVEIVNSCRLFVGDYDLKFDKDRNLYYIAR